MKFTLFTLSLLFAVCVSDAQITPWPPNPTTGFVPHAGGAVYSTSSAMRATAAGTAGQVLTSQGASAPTWTSVGATPAGSNTQVQFNNSGAFGASANLTYASGILSAPTAHASTIVVDDYVAPTEQSQGILLFSYYQPGDYAFINASQLNSVRKPLKFYASQIDLVGDSNVNSGNITATFSGTLLDMLNHSIANVEDISSGAGTPLFVHTSDTTGAPSGGLDLGSGQSNDASGSGNVGLFSGEGTAGPSGQVSVSSGAATGTTGDVVLASGSSSAGNSGNVQLTVGSASGSRGKIQFQDGSEGTSGQVWTSTDVNGSGHWAAGGGSTTSRLFRKTISGYGAVNTGVLIFSASADNNGGSDITYATDANNGDSWTINTAGMYCAQFTTYASGAGIEFSITRNSSSLTGSGASLPAYSQRLSFQTIAGINFAQTANFCGYFAAADIVRFQSTASGLAADAFSFAGVSRMN